MSETVNPETPAATPEMPAASGQETTVVDNATVTPESTPASETVPEDFWKGIFGEEEPAAIGTETKEETPTTPEPDAAAKEAEELKTQNKDLTEFKEKYAALDELALSDPTLAKFLAAVASKKITLNGVLTSYWESQSMATPSTPASTPGARPGAVSLQERMNALARARQAKNAHTS